MEKLLGEDIYARINQSRILVVGAGGIGCELLKNLVMSGFKDIDVLDLDTIDLSNLNRQFLFHREHINQSKAHVAKESVLCFNPNVNIRSHHANIKDAQYHVRWFKQFDLVLNALDNLDARRHVNLMCVAANVPLIESGTAGYDGQVSMHWKGHFQCFDCVHHEIPKQYPVCTIRSTPSTPIHCVVWAKVYLFPHIFGGKEEVENDQSANEPTDAHNVEETRNLQAEALELKALRERSSDRQLFPKSVFRRVFTLDLERLITMQVLWKTRKPPTALHLDEIARDFPSDTSRNSNKLGGLEGHQIWTLAEATLHFLESCANLGERLGSQPDSADGIPFDKDDEDTMRFVAAASTLRSYAFDIQRQTPFQIKSMAGNIIPAIATTNAIIAGKILILAFRYFRHKTDKYLTSYVTYNVSRERVFFTEPGQKSIADCVVCGAEYVTLKANLETLCIRDIIDRLQMKGISAEWSINEGSRMLYDPDFDNNINKPLVSELGCRDGSMLHFVSEEVDSNKTYPKIVVILEHDSTATEIELGDLQTIELRETKGKIEDKQRSDDDDEETVEVISQAGQRRSRDSEGDRITPTTKKNRSGSEEEDLILL